MAATAGNGTVLSSGGNTTLINNTSAGPITAMLANRSSSAGNVIFQSLGLQAPADFGGIAPGGTIYLQVLGGQSLIASCDSGNATYDYAIVARK